MQLSATASAQAKPQVLALMAQSQDEDENGDDNAQMVAMLDALPQDMRQALEQSLRQAMQDGIPQSIKTLMPDQGQNTLQHLTGLREQLEKQEQNQQTEITVRHYHCDHLGTPIALTDEQQNVVWAARLDPWGNVEQEFNPHDIEQSIRLPGQHDDKETGLYYNRHRYYDPSIGSYINQDPIGLMGGVNAHAYPLNPTAFIDALGLFAATALGRALPAAGGLAAVDGPLPIGDALALLLLAGAVACDLTKCLSQEAKRKKCKDATPQNIRTAVSKSPLMTTQRAVSVPVIAAYTQMIEAGSAPPPVKMDGPLIVDGNHRMIAALLCDTMPPSTPGTAPISAPKYPLRDIQPDLTDWGNR